jgi:hypothetical protein
VYSRPSAKKSLSAIFWAFFLGATVISLLILNSAVSSSSLSYYHPGPTPARLRSWPIADHTKAESAFDPGYAQNSSTARPPRLALRLSPS